MSFYATISARLSYEDDETSRRAVSLLEDNGYLGDEEIADWIVDETGERMTESPNIDRRERTIEIPLHLHRNLARLLDEQQLFRGATGKAVWTSTDGCFSGGVVVDGEESTYDLDEWAKEHVLEVGQSPPDPNEDLDAWVEYAEEVEQAFFQEFGD
jgi:hypothetical protein